MSTRFRNLCLVVGVGLFLFNLAGINTLADEMFWEHEKIGMAFGAMLIVFAKEKTHD